MMETEPKFVSVHTLENRFEADLIVSALEQEQIPVLLRSFEETPYNGLFVSQKGWGCIMVPEHFRLKAGDIISMLLRESSSKKLYVDPSGVDPVLWEKLEQVDPGKICQTAQVRFDRQSNEYIVPFLDSELICSPGSRSILIGSSSTHHTVNFELYLVALHYLLEAQPSGITGKWISEKDIPGGQLFFRGPHKFPVEPLLKIFGAQKELFSEAALQLGGSPVEGIGDVACRFWAFPRIPLLYILWEGDDEFEPRLHIRFDGSITTQLKTLDTIWAMVNVVCRSLRSAAKELIGG